MPKAMGPHAPVVVERKAAEDLRELTGRKAPREVHLEEPILCMHVADRPGDIGSLRAANQRHTERVAFDRDRAGNSGLTATVEHREARLERHVGDEEECNDKYRQRSEQPAKEPHGQPADTLRIFIELVPPDTPESSPCVRMTRSPMLTS